MGEVVRNRPQLRQSRIQCGRENVHRQAVGQLVEQNRTGEIPEEVQEDHPAQQQFQNFDPISAKSIEIRYEARIK